MAESRVVLVGGRSRGAPRFPGDLGGPIGLGEGLPRERKAYPDGLPRKREVPGWVWWWICGRWQFSETGYWWDAGLPLWAVRLGIGRLRRRR
jgi:hypothetical protein